MMEVDKKLLDVDVYVDMYVEEAKGRRIWLCAAGLSSLPTCQHLGSGEDEDGAAFIIRLVEQLLSGRYICGKNTMEEFFVRIGDLWGLILSDQSSSCFFIKK